MRLLIAAGGTGGHVYPAIAVAEAVHEHQPEVELAFVGSVGGFERPLIEQAGVTFASHDEVRSGPLNGVSLLRVLLSLVNIALGTLQSLAIILRRRPGALLLTGGWVGFPVALAAWMMRVPMLIFLPDVEPALSIKVLRHLARRVAITVPVSERYFSQGQAVVTGYPLRKTFRTATREAGIAHFGLDPARKTLLVFGGSRGSQSVNNALGGILPALLARGIQVIHVSGTLDWPQVEARRAELRDSRHYHAFPYLHQEMALAMAAADLVVSRAGASILGEFPFFGLASILVPYPYAWRYQKVNADFLAERGAAVVMRDADMPAQLEQTITALFDDSARLAHMRAAAAQLAQPESAWRVGQELLRLAGAKNL